MRMLVVGCITEVGMDLGLGADERRRARRLPSVRVVGELAPWVLLRLRT